MSLIGNILWIILGGLVLSIGWLVAGLICCLTIVGIPFGVQCFKMANLALAPFGREIVLGEFGAGGVLGNVLWILFFGWELCLSHLVVGFLFMITIVGIPFGKQHFKLAGLALMPFGAKID